MPDRITHRFNTPIGLVEVTERGGALVFVDMVDGAELAEPLPAPTELLAEAERQLTEYFSGERREFDLPIHADGTPFQWAVWEQLRKIPYGETCSYGDIARALGKPGAARAVGMANNRNPVGIIVPCHRVVGSTGALVGYAGGLDRKKYLLDLERGVREQG